MWTKYLDPPRRGFVEKAGPRARDRVLAGVGITSVAWYFAAIVLLSTSFGLPADEATSDGAATTAVADTQSGELREFMSLSVSTVATALSLFVGMVLGFQTRREVVEYDRALPRPTFFQWAAVVAYLLSIAATLLIWAFQGGASDPALQYLGRALPGLLVGLLAVLLTTTDVPKAIEDEDSFLPTSDRPAAGSTRQTKKTRQAEDATDGETAEVQALAAAAK